jgi:predicted RNA binding protein YcfA (HicA-like mRNA interferase family)
MSRIPRVTGSELLTALARAGFAVIRELSVSLHDAARP